MSIWNGLDSQLSNQRKGDPDMSGCIWMFSDQLDDWDIAMLQKDFVTYNEGSMYYGLGMKPFTRLAHEAGAVYKIGKMVRIKREPFEAYLRSIRARKN